MRRFLQEVPALAPMKLVVGIDLRGRGDVQHFRLEMPGTVVTKTPATTPACGWKCAASSST